MKRLLSMGAFALAVAGCMTGGKPGTADWTGRTVAFLGDSITTPRQENGIYPIFGS